MMKGLKDSAAPLLPYVEMSNIPAQSPFIASSWDLSITREDGITNLRIPIHLVQPLLVPDDSYLSNMYTDYVRGARFMIQQGTPVSQLLGSTAHIPVDLFFRNREPNDPWDCASWACEIWRSFVEVDGCVRLASVMCLTLMMRVGHEPEPWIWEEEEEEDEVFLANTSLCYSGYCHQHLPITKRSRI